MKRDSGADALASQALLFTLYAQNLLINLHIDAEIKSLQRFVLLRLIRSALFSLPEFLDIFSLLNAVFAKIRLHPKVTSLWARLPQLSLDNQVG